MYIKSVFDDLLTFEYGFYCIEDQTNKQTKILKWNIEFIVLR